MLGQEVWTLTDVMFGLHIHESVMSQSDYVSKLMDRMQHVQQLHSTTVQKK